MSELGKSAIRQRPAGRRITLRRCSSPNLRLSDWCFALTVDMAKLQIALLTLPLLTQRLRSEGHYDDHVMGKVTSDKGAHPSGSHHVRSRSPSRTGGRLILFFRALASNPEPL